MLHPPRLNPPTQLRRLFATLALIGLAFGFAVPVAVESEHLIEHNLGAQTFSGAAGHTKAGEHNHAARFELEGHDAHAPCTLCWWVGQNKALILTPTRSARVQDTGMQGRLGEVPLRRDTTGSSRQPRAPPVGGSFISLLGRV